VQLLTRKGDKLMLHNERAAIYNKPSERNTGLVLDIKGMVTATDGTTIANMEARHD